MHNMFKRDYASLFGREEWADVRSQSQERKLKQTIMRLIEGAITGREGDSPDDISPKERAYRREALASLTRITGDDAGGGDIGVGAALPGTGQGGVKETATEDKFSIEEILLRNLNEKENLVNFTVSIILSIAVKKKIKLVFDENLGKGRSERSKIWEIVEKINDLKKIDKFKEILENVTTETFDPDKITNFDGEVLSSDGVDEVFVFTKNDQRGNIDTRNLNVHGIFIDESGIPSDAVYLIVPVVAISLGRYFIGNRILQSFPASVLKELNIRSIDIDEMGHYSLFCSRMRKDILIKAN